MFNRLKELGLHGLIYSVGSIAQSAAAFVLFPFYTNFLSTEDFGAFSLVDLYGFLIGSIFYLGITSALPRSYFDHSEDEKFKRKEVFTTGFIILLLGFLVQQGFTLITSEKISGLIFKSSTYSDHLRMISLSSGFNFLNHFFFLALRLKRKSITYSIVSLFSLISTLSLTIYFLSYLELGILAPIYSRCIVFCTIFFLLLFKLRKDFVKSFNLTESGIMLRFGIGMVFVNIANISIDWADRFFINNELSLSEVGIYSLAYKLGSIISLVFISPFEQIWNPMMVEYRRQENIKDLFSTVIKLYFVLGIFICALVCVGVLILSPIVIRSEQFLPALKYFPYISMGLLFYGAVNITNAGLIFERKANDIIKVFFFVGGLNLVLNYFIINLMGVWGAVLSTLISYLLLPILIFLESKKYFDFDVPILKIVPSIFLALAYVYGVIIFFRWQGDTLMISLTILSLLILGLILLFLNTTIGERTFLMNKIRSVVQ